jgi:hypothetical protein
MEQCCSLKILGPDEHTDNNTHTQTSVKTMIREFISSSPKEVIGHNLL